jgi:RNA-directed DNA polymerase
MSLPPNQLQTVDGLARNLGIRVDNLKAVAFHAEQRTLYAQFKIPKKNRRRRGEYRTVYKPVQRLALLQKNISTWLGEHIQFEPYVQGFVQRRSTISNATIHLGAKVLLHADIKDFFDSITVAQIREALSLVGCTDVIADIVARSCSLEGHLVQGSSASPLLANLVCRNLDTDLNTLAVSSNCRYSRYADDLTFSGDVVPAPAAIGRAVEKYGFRIRDERCRTHRRGRGQYVTGLSIADEKQPRIPRGLKARLRAELHFASKYGLADHLERIGSDEDPSNALGRISGWMSYVRSVERPTFNKLNLDFQKIQAEFGNEPDDDNYYDGPES